MKNPSAFWSAYILCQLLAIFFIEFDFYYQIATAIFIYQAVSFFYDFGNGLSIRYLMGMLYALNYLFGPVLMYTVYNPFVEIQYTLKGDPDLYFSYTIPATLCFLAGLRMFARKGDEYIDISKIKAIVQLYPNLPVYLITVGFFMTFVVPFAPGELGLIIGSVAQLKFVGLFLHILTTKRFNYLYFGLTYGVLMLQSLTTSMFNDLLNLLFFLAIILAIRLKPTSMVKFGMLFVGIVVIFTIQVIKHPLRQIVMETQQTVQLDQLDAVLDDGLERSEMEGGKGSRLASIVSRVSQGWITSNVLNYYYLDHGFDLQEGNHIWYMIKSSVLPGIIYPEKYNVGDKHLFNAYTGHYLGEGTSMALGILSDGFVDFGYGGVITCFFWGLVFSLAIRLYDKLDKKYPLAKLLSVLCFFYAVRPDTDTHSALGTLVKITFILWLVMLWFRRNYFSDSIMLAIRRIIMKPAMKHIK